MGKPYNYNHFANIYSQTRTCAPWLVNILKNEFAKLKPGTEIIEIGCGTGNYAIELSNIFPDINFRGFDLSEEMLKIARSRTDKVEFARGNADLKFPYTNSTADAVFLVDVIHHIVDYKNFFNECKRVLKPGGILIISTDTEDDFRNRSGIKFFPETLEVERERYPTLNELNIHSENSDLKFITKESITGTYEINDTMFNEAGNIAYSM